MTPCPHCGKRTIGYFARHMSSSRKPVKCKQCGGLSYMPPVASAASIYGNLILVAWPVVAVILLIVTESLLWAAAILIGGLIAFVVAHEIILARTQLVPAPEQEARK
jgi:hypothetical protein